MLHQKNQVEQLITQFKMDEALSVSRVLPAPYSDFYQLNIHFYKFTASQDNEHKTTFFAEWDNALAAVSSLPDDNEHKNILLCEMHSKRASIDFLSQDYVTAAWHLRTAYQYIQTNKKKFPDSPSNLKMAGVYNVLFSNVPKEYQWFMNMLGFKGNFDSGYKQLKAAVNENDILRAEASIILFFTEKNMLGKPKEAIQRLTAEQQKSGKSIILDIFMASGYFGTNENDKAIAILNNRKTYAENSTVFFIPYWDYLLGKSYFYKENYSSAIHYFDLFLKNIKGELYTGDALFRLGMSYLLNGDYTTAKKHFLDLQSRKNSGFDEDAYALSTAKRFSKSAPSGHTKQLYRARNRYDGGYYTESILILDKLKKEITELTQENKVEMYYRYGRVYHQADFPNAAKTSYLACITETTPGNSLYMQPYSCYYLAEMYKKEGQTELARTYYKKALSYNGYLYQNGLESKCKVALNRL
ncbi:MAG: tetratricopeptide repeat protein [Bacteroidia bacterium]|nr:tetratricopeptide repeat protein [Bacteroidia bacterium]